MGNFRSIEQGQTESYVNSLFFIGPIIFTSWTVFQTTNDASRKEGVRNRS